MALEGLAMLEYIFNRASDHGQKYSTSLVLKDEMLGAANVAWDFIPDNHGKKDCAFYNLSFINNWQLLRMCGYIYNKINCYS